MRLLKTFLIICIVFGFATVATADLMTAVGVPVAGIGDNTPVATGLVNPWGVVTIFIPLSDAYSGIFGVDTVPGGKAGTIADSITLPNPTAGGELTIFMRFSPVAVPADEASLKFVFSDLDCEECDPDPPGFIETVQFYDQNGDPLSPAMDVSSDGEYVASDYAFTVETDYSGYSDTQVINFPNITALATDPFYVKVVLDTDLSGLANGTWINTAETIKGTLTSSPASSIPEPGTLLLLGSGLVGIGLWQRRKVRSA